MKRKLTYIACLIGVVVGIAACRSKEQKATKEESYVKVESTEETVWPKEEEPASQPASLYVPTIQMELWKDEFCSIQYNGSENTWIGLELKLYVENTWKKNLAIQVERLMINGHKMDPICSMDVKEGRGVNDTVTITNHDLRRKGMTQESVTTIQISFAIVDPENFQKVSKTDTIELTVG